MFPNENFLHTIGNVEDCPHNFNEFRHGLLIVILRLNVMFIHFSENIVFVAMVVIWMLSDVVCCFK